MTYFWPALFILVFGLVWLVAILLSHVSSDTQAIADGWWAMIVHTGLNGFITFFLFLDRAYTITGPEEEYRPMAVVIMVIALGRCLWIAGLPTKPDYTDELTK